MLTCSDWLTDYPDADPRNLGDVLDTLAESYDFVLVDTGAGMSHEDVLPLGLADHVLLVSSPDPAAYGDTRKTAELAALAEGEVAGLVVTKGDADTDAEYVASAVGVDLLGVIPYDSTVRESTASGHPIQATDPDSPAAAAYRELPNRLADGSADPLTRTPQDVEGTPEPTAATEDDDTDPAAETGEEGSDETEPAGEQAESESAPEPPSPESTTDEEEAVPKTAPPDGSSEVEDEDDAPGADEEEAPTEPPEPTGASDSANGPEEPDEGDEEDPSPSSRRTSPSPRAGFSPGSGGCSGRFGAENSSS